MNLVPTGPASRTALLSIYLNDHLAAAVGAVELARRCRKNNTEPPLSVDVDRLITELDEDRQTLLQVMNLLQVQRNAMKQAGAYVAERAGRLKLNGQLSGYSDLSRLIELEGLILAVTFNRSLWESLVHLKQRTRRLAEVDTDALLARSQRQLKVLAQHRQVAAAAALP